MGYASTHSRWDLGQLIFYDSQYMHRWLDVIGGRSVKFVEDFAADYTATSTGTWIYTASGTAAIASYNIEGGAIKWQSAGNDDDFVQIQKTPGFKFIDDCPIYFGVRWKLIGSAGGSASIIMGLHDLDTTVIASPNTGVIFECASAATGIDMVCYSTGTGVSTTVLATIVDGTWYTDEYYWDGDDSVKVWHNGAYIGAASAASVAQTSSMGITLAWGNEVTGASANATTIGLVVDWVRAFQLLDVRNA